MTKEDFRNWLARRIETQKKLTIGACAAMIALGLLAFLIQGGILYLVLSIGYGQVIGMLVILLLFGGMGFATWVTAPERLNDAEFTADTPDGSVKIRIAPTMANAWTFALGSLDSDQSILEKVVGMFMVVPRMLWTAWYMFGRVEQLKQLDVTACASVMRLLLKEAEKVTVQTLTERRSGLDLPKTLRQVSLIDGVVFLTKRGVGISLAPRLTEDLAKWLEQQGAHTASVSSPFED